MGVPLLYNFKQFPQVHRPSQNIHGISYRWLKDIYISLRVLEKQNWYYANHQEKIPIIFWKGERIGEDFKIIISQSNSQKCYHFLKNPIDNI